MHKKDDEEKMAKKRNKKNSKARPETKEEYITRITQEMHSSIDFNKKPNPVLKIISKPLLSDWVIKRVGHPNVIEMLASFALQSHKKDKTRSLIEKLYQMQISEADIVQKNDERDLKENENKVASKEEKDTESKKSA